MTYQLTALTDAGNKALEDFDDTEFSQMIVGWEDTIRAAKIELPVRFGR